MSRRIILFTGKGGSGKTVCAAATALKAAELGYRTLVISSDAAHSLADVLDADIGPEPRKLADNLYGQEVDLYYSMKKQWADLREVMLLVFKFQGMDRVAAEELAAIPGMSEGAALLWLDSHYQSQDYDLIVVDSAPTGETLTFLTLPQVTQWWMTRALPFQKLAFKTIGATVRNTTGVPVDKAYEQLDDVFGRLDRIHKVLTDTGVSSARIVMNPERMVVQEAKRAYTYLQMYGYAVDAAVMNRILPEEGNGEGPWQRYLDAQKRYLADVDASFEPLPVTRVPHMHEEVLGHDLLTSVADALYGDRDPTEVFFSQQNYRIKPDGKAYVLEIHLPFLENGNLRVDQYGNELVIEYKNQRRNYMLPNFLSFYRKTGSDVKNRWLRVRFEQSPSK
ncbi:ArsA family ATPase [Salinispira pacifica]